VAQMAKRGECGIGGRDHAQVYPNARSGGVNQDERVGGGEREGCPRVMSARLDTAGNSPTNT
jgi:hypothetical protein